MSGAVVPEVASIAALAGLPEVGPARLAALLARGAPAAVLADLAARRLGPDPALAAACGRSDPRPLLERWAAAAAAIDVAALWSAHQEAGITVLAPGSEGWPPAFDEDPDPPAIVFCLGDTGMLAGDRPAVAVVGTRRCTRYGWDVAHRLGRELAAAGVAVVSGLARGIDAAAHRGALDALGDGAGAGVARPVGVVGTGLDVVYPRASRSLWHEVSARGVVLSEAPLGTTPARWRFPARNRLIAALADAVVVVESAGSGGALHTVDEALARDRPVLAVPGPITSPASLGTNRLLRDVAQPVCDTDDVLGALGLPPRLDRPPPPPPRPPVAGPDAVALEAVGFTPTTLDEVAAGAGMALGAAAAALGRLEAADQVRVAGPGRWIRAFSRPTPAGSPGLGLENGGSGVT